MFGHLLSFFPIRKYRVYGQSMEPAYREGDSVLVLNWFQCFKRLKVNDVVVIRYPGKILKQVQDDKEVERRSIIKRIQKINGDKLFVIGDNEKGSTDSREFGWINNRDIVGKVFYKFSLK